MAEHQGFLIFHGVVEGFSILVACGTFIIAWNCRAYMRNSYLLFVGIAYLCVALVDLLHTLAYKGMGVFPSHSANLPTQLWIVGRFLQSLSLLAAPLLLDRPLRPRLTLALFLGITGLLIAWVFAGFFPACYVEGVGLTPFKKISEYVIALILAAAVWLLLRRREAFDPETLRLLAASILTTIFSELAFTFYVSVYGLSNIVGHLLRLGSFCLMYLAVIRDGLTKPFRLIFLDMKRSEDALREANERLQAQALDLEKANRELDAFAHTVAHDLQTPLTTVRGFSSVLQSYLDSGDREILSECVESIDSASDRMSRLIKNLLDLARIRHRPLRRSRVDLSRLAGEIATDLRHAEPGRDAEFVIQSGVAADGDRDLLRVVLENLMGNAWKFTRGRERTRIEFGSTRRDGQDVCFVRDNGIGFDMDDAERMFQAFERLPSAAEIQGTGIGLASVQRIIEKHGGRIWAEGEMDRGGTFLFTLPGSPAG